MSLDTPVLYSLSSAGLPANVRPSIIRIDIIGGPARHDFRLLRGPMPFAIMIHLLAGLPVSKIFHTLNSAAMFVHYMKEMKIA